MSIFGGNASTNKPGMFSGFGNSQPAGNSLFGNPPNNQNNQQQNQNAGAPAGGLFAGFGQNQNQNQAQTTQPGNSGSIFSGFGSTNQNQNQNQAPQPSNPNSVFGGFGGGMTGAGNFASQPAGSQQFQQSGYSFNQPQQQQPTQQQQEQARLLNESSQHLPSFLKSENGGGSRPKDVKDQIDVIVNKWNTNSPDCAFQYYFYNKVPEAIAPFYRPAPGEDEKKWEEALTKKPGPGYIPVLCVGFAGLSERIKTQQRNLAEFNNRLHEINSSLDCMLSKHDLENSIKIMDAKRKHVVLKTRCMALARKVQVLRNRGYALSGEEEVVKQKLEDLEKKVCDPGLAARGEEIWARMLGVKSRADILKEQLNKTGRDGVDGNGADEEVLKKANKILQDYTTQLAYLKKEMLTISDEFKAWLEENGIPEVTLPTKESGADGRSAKDTRSTFA